MGESLISRRGGIGGYKSIKHYYGGLYNSAAGYSPYVYIGQTNSTAAFDFTKNDYAIFLRSYYSSQGTSYINKDDIFIQNGVITHISTPGSSSWDATTSKISGKSLILTFPYAGWITQHGSIFILEK